MNEKLPAQKESGMTRREFLKVSGATIGTIAAVGGMAEYMNSGEGQGVHHEQRESVHNLGESISALIRTIGEGDHEDLSAFHDLEELVHRCEELNQLLSTRPSAMTAYGQTAVESSLSAQARDSILRSLGQLTSKDAVCFQLYLEAIRKTLDSVHQDIHALSGAYVTPEMIEHERQLQQIVSQLDIALQGRIRHGQDWIRFAQRSSSQEKKASDTERLTLENALVSDDKKVHEAIRHLFEAVRLLQEDIFHAHSSETWDRQLHPSTLDRIRSIFDKSPASRDRERSMEAMVGAQSERRKLLFALLRELHRPSDVREVVSHEPATDRQTRARHEMAVLIENKKQHLRDALFLAIQQLENMGDTGLTGKVEAGWSELFGATNAFIRNSIPTTGAPGLLLPDEVTGPLIDDAFKALDRRLVPHLQTVRPLGERLSKGDASVLPELEAEFTAIDKELIAFCSQFNDGIDTALQRADVLKRYQNYAMGGAFALFLLWLLGPQTLYAGVKAGANLVTKSVKQFSGTGNTSKRRTE